MTEKIAGSTTVRRIPVVVTINACMFIFGLLLLLMGSILPSLQVSNERAGSLGSFPLVGILIATVIIGPVLDKAGAKLALVVGLVMIVGAIAVLPSTRSYAAMAAVAFAYGLGGGILNTATNAAISDLNASGRGVALNVLGFSFSLGAVTAPAVISLALKSASIATILRLLACAPACILVAILLLHFPAPAHAGTSLRHLLKVLNQPLVWLFGIILFFASANENCMFVWAGRVVKDTLNIAAQRADLALVGLSVAMGVGRLWAALGLKQLGSRCVLFVAGTILIAGASLVLYENSFAGMVAGFALTGLGMSAIFPTTLGMAGDCFPSQTGTVFGAVMTVALVGGVTGPLVGGWAAGFGPQKVLAVPIVAGVAIAALSFLTSSSQQRTQTP